MVRLETPVPSPWNGYSPDLSRIRTDVTLEDIDAAMAAVPAPTCYADYGKVYRILPGGKIEEIKDGESE